MILDLTQLNPFQSNTLPTSGTIPRSLDNCLIFLYLKYIHRTTIHQSLRIFLMLELFIVNCYLRHQTIETSWYRWPFCMFLSNTLLCIQFKVDLLILSQLCDQYILMQYFHVLNWFVTLRYEFQVTCVNVSVL